MRIIVERKPFLSLLQRAAGNVIPKKTSIPIVQYALLSVLDTKRIEISSTDLEIFLKEQMPAEVETEAVGKSWAIDSKFFVQLLPKIDSEIITIDILKESIKLTIGQNEYSTPYLNGDDFPTVPKMADENTNTIQYDTDILKNYFNKCLPFTSNDDTRPVICGIKYTQTEGKVTLTSVDMAKLLYAVDTTDSTEEFEVVIPKKFADTYIKLYDGEHSLINLDSNYIRIYGKDFMLHARKIDGNYPNTESIIHQVLSSSIKIKKEEVILALKRLTVLNSVVKIIAVDISENGLILSTESKEYKTSGKELFDHYTMEGSAAVVGMNPDMFITGLSAFRSEEITINYENSTRPLVLTDDFGAIKVLLMPLMVHVSN